MKKIFVFIFIFFSLPCFCYQENYYILRSRDAGFFSIFSDVLALCHNYEKCELCGFEVDFKDYGLYFDKKIGLNWWLYYCEPLKVNTAEKKIELFGYPNVTYIIEEELTREKANYLINKYFKIKKEINDEIEEFVKNNFSNRFVISVHYRGGDKITEAPRVEFDIVRKKTNEIFIKYHSENPIIFIATDDQGFIDYMEEYYGSICVYYPYVNREYDQQGIHNKRIDPYLNGKSALIDSILLSKGNYLLRCDSNLSLWSTFFNSNIPVYKFNKRY